MLGLQRGTVRLEEHSEEWHSLFEGERRELLDAVPADEIVSIEHIGSTAVCGIPAKPILDIMIGMRQFRAKSGLIAAIEAIGYEYKGENGIAARHFFGKGTPRTVHLNVVEFEGDLWHAYIAFRDYLKEHRGAVIEYARLKRSLAERFFRDRESYTNGKVDFVEHILSLSGISKL